MDIWWRVFTVCLHIGSGVGGKKKKKTFEKENYPEFCAAQYSTLTWWNFTGSRWHGNIIQCNISLVTSTHRCCHHNLKNTCKLKNHSRKSTKKKQKVLKSTESYHFYLRYLSGARILKPCSFFWFRQLMVQNFSTLLLSQLIQNLAKWWEKPLHNKIFSKNT